MWAYRAVLLAVLCYAYTVHSMLESDEEDDPTFMSLAELLQSEEMSEEMTTLCSTTCDDPPSDTDNGSDVPELPSPQSSPAGSFKVRW